MLQKQDIENHLRHLNKELARAGVKGELCLYGGTVMCLVYNTRPSTQDVDAIFVPAQEMRKAAKKVAEADGLPDDWMNDAVKGFVVEHPKRIFMDLSNLKVYVPESDYLLAMKALSARLDGPDREDLLFLIKKLGLKSAGQIFEILRKYYPNERIKPATQYFVEEIFQNDNS